MLKVYRRSQYFFHTSFLLCWKVLKKPYLPASSYSEVRMSKNAKKPEKSIKKFPNRLLNSENRAIKDKFPILVYLFLHWFFQTPSKASHAFKRSRVYVKRSTLKYILIYDSNTPCSFFPLLAFLIARYLCEQFKR